MFCGFYSSPVTARMMKLQTSKLAQHALDYAWKKQRIHIKYLLEEHKNNQVDKIKDTGYWFP
jgi:hypothetical protein